MTYENAYNMCNLKNHNWISGSGDSIAFEDIINIVKDCVDNGSKIFIGSDSFTSKNKVNFATAICLYGSDVVDTFFLANIFQRTNMVL